MKKYVRKKSKSITLEFIIKMKIIQKFIFPENKI